MGFCWKSGVAAEVIGVPDHSIGEKLYMAKIYLSTDELLAWTLVVILLSALFEKLCLWLLGRRAVSYTHLPVGKALFENDPASLKKSGIPRGNR